jgi:dTDP-4-dehydrorhamnose 3,5-epimerase
VTNLYAPELDRGIRWNDPALGINWGIAEGDALISQKDKAQPLLKDAADLF